MSDDDALQVRKIQAATQAERERLAKLGFIQDAPRPRQVFPIANFNGDASNSVTREIDPPTKGDYFR